MIHTTEPVSRLTEPQIEAALRDLFEPAPAPDLRPGFDRRLARALETVPEVERGHIRLRRLVVSYWVVAGIASLATLWRLHTALTPGPGLWLSIAGTVTLVGASLLFSILAALPVTLGRRLRGLSS